MCVFSGLPSRDVTHSLTPAACIFLATACSLVCLKFAAVPYGVSAAAWFVALAYIAMTSVSPWAKRLFLTAATIAVSIGALEVLLWAVYAFRPVATWRYSESFIVRDDVLGYAPAKNKRILAQLIVRDRHLYDATYTLDQDGHRVTPSGSPSTSCVVFFGDSYTFGEGVDDSQTMPWIVGAESGLSAVNLGFSGYGPHQMLAALEANRNHRIIRCQPRAVVYQAIGEHPSRASGYAPWDRHGPQYVATAHGLASNGHFDDHVQELVAIQLTKSYLFEHYLFYASPLVVQRSRLFSDIVDASRRQVNEQFPNAAFIVIFWNDPSGVSAGAAHGLHERRINVRLVSEILPGYPENASVYEHSPYDRHPNAAAHRLIAKDVIRNVLQ